MTSKNRQYIDKKGDRQMEVNMEDIMKYAIGGAALFVVIAIVIVTLFIKSKNRRNRKKELEQKKKESHEVNQIKEEKLEKKKAPKKQKAPAKRQEEVVVKPEVIAKQEVILKPEVTAKQEEAVVKPEVIARQEEVTLKQEVAQPEKQSDTKPIDIIFYTVKVTGREDNRAFTLGKEINIGRDKDSNDWVIENDQTVSSSHCRIYQQDGAAYIEDKGSTNGTYVNSQRIMRATRLENHDKVRIGQGEYRVRC